MLTMDDIIVPPPAPGETLDPMRWFDTPGPLEIEIGCGKGGFLLSRAGANPKRRFLGIEWAAKYFRFCADRMARWNRTNVRVMRTDARHLFVHHLPAACVSVLHLYHPDPWPKKKHHKRRLVGPEFVQAAVNAIAPGGIWLIQSDHRDYFQAIRALLGGRTELTEVSWLETGIEAGSDWAGTNYEIKYSRTGRTILRAAYVLRPRETRSPDAAAQTERKTALNTASLPTH